MNEKFTGTFEEPKRAKEPRFVVRNSMPLPKCKCFAGTDLISAIKQSLIFKAETQAADQLRGMANGVGLCREGKQYVYAMVTAAFIADLQPYDGLGDYNAPRTKEQNRQNFEAAITETEEFFDVVREWQKTAYDIVIAESPK